MFINSLPLLPLWDITAIPKDLVEYYGIYISSSNDRVSTRTPKHSSGQPVKPHHETTNHKTIIWYSNTLDFITTPSITRSILLTSLSHVSNGPAITRWWLESEKRGTNILESAITQSRTADKGIITPFVVVAFLVSFTIGIYHFSTVTTGCSCDGVVGDVVSDAWDSIHFAPVWESISLWWMEGDDEWGWMEDLPAVAVYGAGFNCCVGEGRDDYSWKLHFRCERWRNGQADITCYFGVEWQRIV